MRSASSITRDSRVAKSIVYKGEKELEYMERYEAPWIARDPAHERVSQWLCRVCRPTACFKNWNQDVSLDSINVTCRCRCVAVPLAQFESVISFSQYLTRVRRQAKTCSDNSRVGTIIRARMARYVGSTSDNAYP